MKSIIRTLAVIGSAALVAASCTMKSQEAPPLTGPSEFGTSVTVEITPDVLQLDGASQAVVLVTVRDSAGQPKPGVPLRAEILVNGLAVDFGRLSARSIASGSDGKATLIYTAPAVNSDAEALIDIAVTPIGSNYQNAVPRTATIRLVPTGIRVPPSDLVPAFTFSPTNPTQDQEVLFNASTSRGSSITEYRWDFGNGRTGAGQTATTKFSDPGTYFVRLTLVDSVGRSATTVQSVTVGQGGAPTADFSFSPTNPQPGNTVFFNAEASSAAVGRRIVSWSWDFGDGTTGTGERVSHTYPVVERTYNVTLTVTDDIGRKSTVTRSVSVEFPDEDGGQPTH